MLTKFITTMKQFILFLLFTVTINYTFAQSKTHLKGPKYKNYKPRIAKKSKAKIYSYNQDQLKGPKAKNNRRKIARASNYSYRVPNRENQKRMGKHKKLNVGTTHRRVRR